METIPNIGAGPNQVIGTGLIYGDDYSYSFTPTLTKIIGNHTLKVGANICTGKSTTFRTTIRAAHLPTPTRRRRSMERTRFNG